VEDGGFLARTKLISHYAFFNNHSIEEKMISRLLASEHCLAEESADLAAPDACALPPAL